MATITIPFPSKESLLGPEIARAASPPKISVKAPPKKQTSTLKKQPVQPKSVNGVGKPKQTKSRNGCATCKEKRLKCDETKPHCEQCKRRNVECGGYNKIFQWRPEEKATFRANPTSKVRKRSTVVKHPNPPPSSPVLSDTAEPGLGNPSSPPKANTFPLDPQADQSGYAQATSQLNFDPDKITPGPYDVPNLVDDAETFPSSEITIDEDTVCTDADLHSATRAFADNAFEDTLSFDDMICSSSSDIALPNFLHEISGHPNHDAEFLDYSLFDNNPGGEGEQIPQRDDDQLLIFRCPSPSLSTSSSPSSGAQSGFSIRLKEPGPAPDSPEMLVSMFSKMTCGILSIKDGPTENPWRTMLLPMSADVPALRHAILSMTAFHAARQDPRFRIAGLRHSQKSLHHLCNRLGTMRKDAALATTLVLAFAESWDQETSTGIRHLRAARRLITQAMNNNENAADFDEIERLKFLRNTWVYMDVIARITAMDVDDLEDLDTLFTPIYGPEGLVQELDPLMGSAATFFPLLGRVANLVHEIRDSPRISPRVVSRAAGLRTEILRWRAPSHFQEPEDESIEIAHSIKTAEAYRWATLLFLYEAVPMIATENLADLAEKVLYDLVFVPTSSRLVIVHIFPLLAASCGIIWEDNRLLVEERWHSMIERMTIGNLDRCLDVIHEVWKRRDGLKRPYRQGDEHVILSDGEGDNTPGLTRQRRNLHARNSHPAIVRPDQLKRTSANHLANIDPELTVRGRCHWLSVMKDWNWAVLLG